ncbi:hypothetical protein G7Y89_g919 [Cudoniella acicularis]|uniref:Uncharacterized protein n=1 Tax=Cudoniella acicularis TaxID=354080 RepID=A0A8H4WA01_9HELO|nr:hypothetical protein G7Y89_g919 [Cudoniella acicularis]
MAIPDDDNLLTAVKALRIKEPALARAKVLQKLKEENDWELSEKRLKACMDEHALNSTTAPASITPKARDAAYDEIAKDFFEEFTRRRVDEVSKPLIEKYDIKAYGFTLRQISHATMIDMGRPEPDKFWQGGYVFADTTSPLWPYAQAILLPTAQLNITRKAHDAYEDKGGKALGYPVPRFPPGSERRIAYTGQTEREIFVSLFGDRGFEVFGFEYLTEIGTKPDWQRYLLHYDKCVKAMKSVGRVLFIDLDEYPELQEFMGEGMGFTKEQVHAFHALMK